MAVKIISGSQRNTNPLAGRLVGERHYYIDPGSLPALRGAAKLFPDNLNLLIDEVHEGNFAKVLSWVWAMENCFPTVVIAVDEMTLGERMRKLLARDVEKVYHIAI